MAKKYAKKLRGLTDIQFDVTQNGATERPFDNEYWNHESAIPGQTPDRLLWLEYHTGCLSENMGVCEENQHVSELLLREGPMTMKQNN